MYSPQSQKLTVGSIVDRYTKEAIKNTCDWIVENHPNVRGFND